MIKRLSLSALLALSMLLGGCGPSGGQQGNVPANQAGQGDAGQLCDVVIGTGLVKLCSLNDREETVDATIDSYDDQVARNICAAVVKQTMQQTAHLSMPWRLQIFSPYRSDKPLAACLLHADTGSY